MGKRGYLILIAVGALGASCVMTQLALMREFLGVFSGNEMVLGVTLGLWLLLVGIGASLGRTSERLRNPVAALAVIQLLLAILPIAQVFLLRSLRNVVFLRGAAIGVGETVGAAFVLLLPYCLAAGYALTLACAILGHDQGPAGVGRAYIADSIGSILGGILFTLVMTLSVDHIAILVWPGLLNLLLAALLSRKASAEAAADVSPRHIQCERMAPTDVGGYEKSDLKADSSTVSVRRSQFSAFVLPGLAALLGIGLLTAGLFLDLDALSTRLQYAHQCIVARAISPYGRLIVTESAGQFDFLENGVPVTSTRDDQHVEETVHYAMAQRPDAQRVLLVSGGISGTAREVLKYGVGAVDYVELDPLILTLGRRFLPANLADRRIRISNTDGRLFVRRTPEKYEVAIVDVPVPATAQLNRFYTAEFLSELRAVLATNGVVCFALGEYANYVSPELARMLSSASLAAKHSFHNVLAIPGGRVFLLASDGPLYADIAARLEQHHVQNRLVNRHYLDAMLTADRMSDLANAIAQPAVMNRDFSPVLYYYHLRRWMSQFDVSFGLLQVLLVAALGFYLIRLRGAALVLLASGFAASALEVVLLLAFQILCGSVYYQVAVIVTVFMAGLALGGLLANRMAKPGRWSLPGLAFAIAAYAALLPVVLPQVNRLGSTAASLMLVQVIFSLLTLGLAMMVGLQFPLANRLEFDGTARGASRLYTADFMGASLGALLSCTLLIPLIGVAGVCLLTAALNLAAGLMGRLWQFR